MKHFGSALHLATYLVLVLLGFGSAGTAAQSPSPKEVQQQRVLAASRALLSSYDAETGLFRGTGWWNSANGLTALVDASRELHTREFDFVIRNTFDRAQGKFPGFRNDFYDDEGWWALAWVDAYRLRHEAKYLKMGKSIFADMSQGWSESCGGGIWWKKNEHYKNAIANELFFSLAVQLADLTTGEEREGYVRWAQREERWFLASGMINQESLVNDGLDSACKNNGKTTWTYNQGVLLRGFVGLTALVGDSSALQTANAIAGAAISHLTDNAGVLHDVCEPECGEDGVQFKGILVRNVASLYRASPTKPLLDFLTTNGNAVWERARSANNRFSVVWSGPPKDDGTGALISALDALNASLSTSTGA